MAHTSPDPIEALLPDLANSSHTVRAAAVRALGASRNPAAVPAIIPLLGDRTLTVRQCTANALGTLGGSDALVALATALEERNHRVVSTATRYLTKAGASAILPVGTIATDPARGILARLTAVTILGRIGTPTSLPFLERVLLEGADPRMPPEIGVLRERAVEALLRVHDDRARALLRRMADDPNDQVRRAAVRALVSSVESGAEVQTDPDLITALAARLRRGDLSTVEPLRRLGYEHLGDELAAMLDDTASPNHFLLPLYLAYVGDERARGPLEAEHLSHPYPAVRIMAEEALAFMDWQQGNRRDKPAARMFLGFVRRRA